MVKIAKGEHGPLVDGKPIDEEAFLELDDKELEEATGGIRVYLHVEEHWYGNDCTTLKCQACGGDDWDIVSWSGENELWARCKKCGNKQVAKFY